MPTLPWSALANLDSGDECVAVATRFELTSRLHMGRTFSAAQALIATFTSTLGLRGYSLRASITRNALWTLSAWSTEYEMRQFVRGAAHVMIVNKTAHWMRASSFVTWVESAGSPVPRWVKATRFMRAHGDRATPPSP